MTRKAAFKVFVLLFLALVVLGVGAAFLLQGCARSSNHAPEAPGSIDLNSDTPWGYPHAGKLLHKVAFTIGYDPQKREPLWVAYHVDRENVGLRGLTKRQFVPDPELPPDESATDRDYRGSGYDRGHMAPFASVRRPNDPRPECESCYFSNICPQSPGLNRVTWAHLEKRVRDWAVRYGRVWVIVGPVFGPGSDWTRSGRVAVPTAFYMVIIRQDQDGLKALAFEMGQSVHDPSEHFERFLTSVGAVERETGLDFLTTLPDEVRKQLETFTPRDVWPN